jgi:hypothetical protein
MFIEFIFIPDFGNHQVKLCSVTERAFMIDQNTSQERLRMPERNGNKSLANFEKVD